MSEEYWRAKIWGLLHDPVLKALHDNTGRGKNSFYEQLEVMKPWVEIGKTPDDSGGKALANILLADHVASASDRSAIGGTTAYVNYAEGNNPDKGLQIRHLLSGAKQDLKVKFHQQLINGKRAEFLFTKEDELLAKIPKLLKQEDIENNIPKIKQLYWWLWRCLPQVTCDIFTDSSLMLMPAETRIPDASIWSHVSMTAALAGGFAGYDLTLDEIKNWPRKKPVSHPYLAVFSFTPVQELIKSSRKMRDFWAGSWLLHYLSAKVCWKLANQYGPDTLLYPSLYQQPLIDHWLVQKYPEFAEFIGETSPELLLTAGFPNVIALVLPEDKVQAAMQTAQQTLLEEWLKIGDLVLEELQHERHWMKSLDPNHTTWKGWLKSQWQTYWTALPIGKPGTEFKCSANENKNQEFESWSKAQNETYNLINNNNRLFKEQEKDLLQESYRVRQQKYKRGFSANIGSWWGYIFDATRDSLASVKNARNWELPTAFGPRSTISGIGSVVSPGKDGKDWMTEGDTKKLWKHRAGFFDGTEQLNATEVLKRGLHKILPHLLGIENLEISYPDLTSGVAGYLKVNQSNPDHKRKFDSACQAIVDKYPEIEDILIEMRGKWGIPWIDKKQNPKKYHPRLLNAGWILEDLPNNDELKEEYTTEINEIISKHYPSNNPSDWYVLAAGDGDSMSEWLKGTKLKTYSDYIPDGFAEKVATATTPLTQFPEFLKLTKRMGPSTHSALSRALLDFSNQLVPYLTQTRYAGRLIYGGGDDVLAYTNLWEWDKWLWDIRQCFRGAEDPFKLSADNQGKYFDNPGDYWSWSGDRSPLPEGIHDRPLFTMGSAATISFGIVIAHHSVPLAIALESLWDAEDAAKKHEYHHGCELPSEKRGQKDCFNKKDAVQVRVLYGNGNTLKSTAKFDVFHQWQQLIKGDLDSAIFEQAASLWSQHPAPSQEAIKPWTKLFCDRRDQFQTDKTAKEQFQIALADFLTALFSTTQTKNLDTEIQNWLKLAAFVKRNRHIKLGGDN
ncbi:type III-B CRISPR-associated protein Cas10/Cmr2 [Anabaena cylindrica FACHB-243]|uniref:CRISPR-associated protein, Crm2 family n=1 Tax=Anabaena cylindrica (strain ATCC 27899 / PCC 7122) TaxID=272123 RepID=K9ZPV7_ANACC|nr:MULTISPECIES: type III-B CRISPR-associated protein Cas10/Cmr2 [Anabaena]AFZ61248.1 CRISPR-associated protein, Crm2 family [Anabaena cylindrica PCC 7122]MBD2416680.1 type III-B CRISPR-associated protein Cas10/Cmr2 [Anabaena cylindrica FACHB-243]MBY5284455.1 type III-B CRISPR-associated protein Cas10/Cmr2 [Anabaena sp. CCAP 1446/1C]MBY5311448.1 type III-B CRISPR-associated protein Cas10/Cmr2 [Anabaena sp. CCAP 1446/1C]MCM2408687.1 type III-B CRISPR-associated protein Cas10/Cmr2 [Anabaena sp. 